ncbi:hypothetical protein Tco_1241809, partial [Tanacetum coccineum]
MLNKKLQADQWNEMVYQLLKLMGRIVGIKRLLEVTTAQGMDGDLGIGEEVVTCKLYLGLDFIVLTLERVTIGCYEVGGGGGGGGVIGGVGVVCGDDVDSGVRGVVCGVVCGFVCGVVCGVVCGGVCLGEEGVVKELISMMIVSVPKKDRWRVRDVIIDGGRGEDIKHDTSVEWFYYKIQGHVTIVFELQRHQGDQDVDDKGNALCCYFDAFLTSVEPKNFKEAMLESSWIKAMQEEFMNLKDYKFGNWCPIQIKQEEGIDFEESFASVARIEAIRIF